MFEGHEGVFDIMSDAVSCLDRNVGVDFEVDIHDQVAAAAADDQCFDIEHGRVGSDSPQDGLGLGVFEAPVHEFVQGWSQNADGIVGDEEGDKERGELIKEGKARPGEDGDGDAREGGQRGKTIATMVKGFGPQGDAVVPFGGGDRVAVEAFLGENDGAEGRDGKEGRRGLRTAELANSVPCDEDSRAQQAEACHEGGKGFRFAVTIGMFVVRFPSTDAETVPDDQGGDAIGDGLDPIGDQGIGRTREADENFEGSEGQVGDKTEGANGFW